MIKIGMNLFLWSDNTNFAQHKGLLDFCKEVGFDGVEFNVALMDDPEDCRRFGEYAKELGLGVTTVATLNPSLYNPISPDPSLRKATYPAFKRYVDLTVELGATLICGPLFQGLGYFSGARPTKDEWNYSLDTMIPCFEYARDRGVTVAVEPLNRFEAYLINTVDDGIRYVKDVGLDNVGLLVDTMHANIEELDIAESFRKALPYIKHVHISENNRGIPGTGHACGKEIFDVFKQGGYNGYMTIEAFNLGAPSLVGALHLWRTFAPSDDQLAKQGYEYIKKMLAD
ncbi:MAG TPA: sugar phosphate isomerase/epimerase [Clostridiales bacterium]|nr:sugar phosphate isomerase/epimerase [Clostridiales bacterium]